MARPVNIRALETAAFASCRQISWVGLKSFGGVRGYEVDAVLDQGWASSSTMDWKMPIS